MEFIDLKEQYRRHREALDKALLEVAGSARYINGPQVAELEERLASFVGTQAAVGVGSGTEALVVALMALDLKPGDEVICPAFTFIASATSVILAGGRPVPADVEPLGGTLDPEAVRAAITPKTVGLIPVGLFGQCAAMNELEALAEERGLWIIEDAAQSLGAAQNGRRSGSFGQIGVTSFFPAKPLGAMGDAGMAFTDDPELAARMQCLRSHGQTRRYEHAILGFNGRLDTIQAAVLLAKLGFFEEEIRLRDKVAAAYGDLLAGIEEVRTPRLLPGNTSVWAQYTLQAEDRDGLVEHLRSREIPIAIHYPKPVSAQPVITDLGLTRAPAPVSDRLSAMVLSLPMHPYLTAADQSRIAGEIKTYYGR